MENIVELWKELNIEKVLFNFDCGGDSMGDTNIVIINKDNKEISNNDIETYIDDNVYNRVDFYVNSDGHYIGEEGVVIIRLDEEEEELTYEKEATSTFSETTNRQVEVELTNEEIDFVKNFVSEIGGGFGERTYFNFKKDFIITDEIDTLMKNLIKKIDDVVSKYEPDIEEGGELEEWYRFTTNEDNLSVNSDVEIIDNTLILNSTFQYIIPGGR